MAAVRNEFKFYAANFQSVHFFAFLRRARYVRIIAYIKSFRMPKGILEIYWLNSGDDADGLL